MLIGGTAKSINFALPKPTNLTNTKWCLNSRPKAPSKTSFTINLTVGESVEQLSGNSLEISYTGYYCDIIRIKQGGAGMGIYSNNTWDLDFNVWYITGGTDTSDSIFIDWLWDNATRIA